MNTFFLLIGLVFQVFVIVNSGSAGLRQDDEPKIIHDYATINSMSQLNGLFDGKPYYINLWATWCAPCHDEFKYNRELCTHLKNAGVQIVYIAFDREAQDSAWRADIYKNKLSGYHIRASKQLQDSLTTLIWGAKDAYSIPHFLLFDKDGRVVSKAAPEPHAGQKLYDFVEEKLKNKF